MRAREGTDDRTAGGVTRSVVGCRGRRRWRGRGPVAEGVEGGRADCERPFAHKAHAPGMLHICRTPPNPEGSACVREETTAGHRVERAAPRHARGWRCHPHAARRRSARAASWILVECRVCVVTARLLRLGRALVFAECYVALCVGAPYAPPGFWSSPLVCCAWCVVCYVGVRRTHRPASGARRSCVARGVLCCVSVRRTHRPPPLELAARVLRVVCCVVCRCAVRTARLLELAALARVLGRAGQPILAADLLQRDRERLEGDLAVHERAVWLVRVLLRLWWWWLPTRARSGTIAERRSPFVVGRFVVGRPCRRARRRRTHARSFFRRAARARDPPPTISREARSCACARTRAAAEPARAHASRWPCRVSGCRARPASGRTGRGALSRSRCRARSRRAPRAWCPRSCVNAGTTCRQRRMMRADTI